MLKIKKIAQNQSKNQQKQFFRKKSLLFKNPTKKFFSWIFLEKYAKFAIFSSRNHNRISLVFIDVPVHFFVIAARNSKTKETRQIHRKKKSENPSPLSFFGSANSTKEDFFISKSTPKIRSAYFSCPLILPNNTESVREAEREKDRQRSARKVIYSEKGAEYCESTVKLLEEQLLRFYR